jgi:uncharacterized membrane protein
MTYLLSVINLLAGFVLLCAAVDACGRYRRNLAGAVFWASLGLAVIVNGARLWP